MMYEHGWNMTSGWGWFGMTAMMLLWIAIIALGIYFVTRAMAHSTHDVHTTTPDQDRSMSLLRERLARGEINEEEFRRVINTLQDTAR
ncbi:MAG: hypothetical protein WBW04_08685 [Nitrolancea sp.]